jgi:hypothetical protein
MLVKIEINHGFSNENDYKSIMMMRQCLLSKNRFNNTAAFLKIWVWNNEELQPKCKKDI